MTKPHTYLTNEYLAGYFDARGHVQVVSRNGALSLRVHLWSKDIDFLREMRHNFGFGYLLNQPDGNMGLRIEGRGIDKFMYWIKTHSVIKVELIDAVLEFRRTKRKLYGKAGVPEDVLMKRQQFAEKIVELNGKN